MKKFSTKLLLGILLLSSSIASALEKSHFVSNPNVIIFDVEALAALNSRFVKHYGYWDAARAFFQGDLRHLFTKTLSQVPSPVVAPQDAKIIFTNLIKDELVPMPSLQYAYLTGKVSYKECEKLANDWIDANKNKFASDYQRNLMKKTISFYFEPGVYYRSHSYSNTVDLMKKLYSAKDTQGKRKNVVVLVGDQSSEQVDALKKIFTNIFTNSDIQLFSCDHGFLHSNGQLKDEVINKALSLVPSNPYYVSFVVDYSPKQNRQVMGHKIETITPNQAESVLNSYGVLQ